MLLQNINLKVMFLLSDIIATVKCVFLRLTITYLYFLCITFLNCFMVNRRPIQIKKLKCNAIY